MMSIGHWVVVCMAAAACSSCGTSLTPAAVPPPGATQGLPPKVSFTEEPIELGVDHWMVPGVITLPNDGLPAPAVVLVHGFGPGTIDADVGPNKIFLESAHGLATRGVASVRFAKRTTAHHRRFDVEQRTATLEEEWIEDAAAAVRRLQADPRIDGSRIYVAGHSASAAMAAHIANITGAAGAVLVNGSARDPGELIRDQALYMLSLPDAGTEEKAGAAETLLAAERLIANAAQDDSDELGYPMWFWRSLAALDPVSDIQALERGGGRVLIARGGRDYLTNERDWQSFAALSGNPGVTFLHLPTLNHMMQPGHGPMSPAEYRWKMPVSDEWLQELADWIKG